METPPVAEFRDRKVGLVIFGVAEIMIGFLCLLVIPLVLFGRMVASRAPNAPPSPPSIAPVIIIYAFAAVAFIWLGVGSALARRWARALLLCFSSVALCGGVFAFVMMAFLLPHIFDAVAQNTSKPMPPGALTMMKTVTLGAVLVIYVLIPGALFLFYRSPHVKRTCEVRDPVERWTDRCPLPVLALSLLMLFGALVVLGLLVNFHVMPVFGVFVTGGAGHLLVLLMAALLLYLARGLYRLQIGAWWISLGMLGLSAISNMVTFWGGDIGSLYAKMGIDARAVAMIGPMLNSPAFKWMVPLGVVPWLIWLLCIRRYFSGTGEAPPALTQAEPPAL